MVFIWFLSSSEQYSCLIPVMKALLEKSEEALSLTASVPDLPSLANSPVFFQEFQTYCTSKSWKKFIAKKVRKSRVSYISQII